MLKSSTFKKIDECVDSKEFLKMAAQIAQKASKLNSNQMRNLQNIVNSTTRFSEISNFVKAQVGRHREKWGEPGEAIIEALKKIDEYAEKISAASDKESKGEIRLHLCRHWVKIVLAEFLYASKEENKKR